MIEILAEVAYHLNITHFYKPSMGADLELEMSGRKIEIYSLPKSSAFRVLVDKKECRMGRSRIVTALFTGDWGV